jgi:hypothetical protein
MWVYIACSIVFSFALGMLWSTFQTVQILTALPLLAIKVPANVIQVFQGFNDIVNMEMVDTGLIWD